MSSDIYHELILDHYQNPRNKGKIEVDKDTLIAKNIGCADEFLIQIKTDQGKIKKVIWQGQGCAISTAAISWLSDELVGLSLDQAVRFPVDKLQKSLGLTHLSESRKECLNVGLNAIRMLKNKA